MATYSGNVLRMGAPQEWKLAPGSPDSAHSNPAGPDQVPEFRAQEIAVAGDLGAEYAGLTMEDGIPRAVMVGQPGLGWNAPSQSSTPVGGGGTPAGSATAWTQGDPHNAEVDTSFAGAARGAITGTRYGGNTAGVHAVGDDTEPYRRANPVGVAGTTFLERLWEFPRQMWGEPAGAGADKFVAGTNSYASSNPENDQFAEGRGGARAHYGFQTDYFVHQALFIDKTPQTYDRRTAPITARDPLVGGAYTNTPTLGQLAPNPWLSELGQSVTPTGYGVPVDGAM